MNFMSSGQYTLGQTQSAIVGIESRLWRLTAVRAGDEKLALSEDAAPVPVNRISVEEEDWATGRKALELEAVPDASKWGDQVKARKANGWKPLFEWPQTIFVEGKTASVGFFRKV